MRVSTSAYYAWTNNPDRQNKTKKETELKAKRPFLIFHALYAIVRFPCVSVLIHHVHLDLMQNDF
jgi:hypothetical protein